MTALQAELPDDVATSAFRHAVESADVDGVVATLAPDVVLHSPITDRVTFVGRDEIEQLLPLIFETIRDIRYFADVGNDHTRALFYRARVRRQLVEEATRIELDDERRVRSITVFFRPLPGLATLTAALGPRVAHKHGRIRSLLARLVLAPLGFATRVGDRLVKIFA
jgi:hypothetical protein